MAKIIKPPHQPSSEDYQKESVFLAGSIEMGAAENWQLKMEKALNDLDIVIYNPRRDNWDSTWEQSIDNEYFRAQVEWELDKLEDASVIAMYFDPSTQSPITLLELGLFSLYEDLIVCCPKGYYRKGNVDIVCNKYLIDRIDSFQELVEAVRNRLIQKGAKRI